MFSSKLQGRSLLVSSLLRVVAGNPLLFLCLQTHQSNLCLCLRIMCSFRISLCSILHVYSVLLCLCVFFFYKDTSHIGLGLTVTWMRSHVTLIKSAKSLFLNSLSQSQAPGVKAWICLFLCAWETQFNPCQFLKKFIWSFQ